MNGQPKFGRHFHRFMVRGIGSAREIGNKRMKRLSVQINTVLILAVLSALPVRGSMAKEPYQESCSFLRGGPKELGVNITHIHPGGNTESCIWLAGYTGAEAPRLDHFKGTPLRDLSWTSFFVEDHGGGSALAPSFFASDTDPQRLSTQPEAGAVHGDPARPPWRAEMLSPGLAPAQTEMTTTPAGPANWSAAASERLPFDDLGEPHRVHTLSLGPARPPWRAEMSSPGPASAQTEMAATSAGLVRSAGLVSRNDATPERQSFTIFGEPLRVRTFSVNLRSSIKPSPAPTIPTRSSSPSGTVAQAAGLRGSIRELGEALNEPASLGEVASAAKPSRAGSPFASVPAWPW